MRGVGAHHWEEGGTPPTRVLGRGRSTRWEGQRVEQDGRGYHHLHDEGDLLAHLVDLLRVLAQLGRQLVVVADLELIVEDLLEVLLVPRRDDDDDRVQPRLERLLDEDQDGRLEDTVGVKHREERGRQRLGRGEEVLREGRRRDQRLRHRPRLADLQREAAHLELALDDLDDLLHGLGRLAQQLRAAVALRADALGAPDVRLERRVAEDLVQVWRRQLRRADGHRVPAAAARKTGGGEDTAVRGARNVTQQQARTHASGGVCAPVEEHLRLRHQLTELLHVSRAERLHRRLDDALVGAAEQVLQVGLLLVVGDRVALVQPLQDGRGVLCARQLDDHNVERRAERQLVALEQVAVELHQHGPRAECAALVHPAALRRRRDLAVVREVHLASHRQLQVVHAVERARREHGRRGRRREALGLGQVGLVVLYHQAPAVVPHRDLVGDAVDVGKVRVAARRLLEQHLRVHRHLDRPVLVAAVVVARYDQLVRVRPHARVHALVGARDEAHSRHDVAVELAVASRPVRVLTHQADAARHEDLEPAAVAAVAAAIAHRATVRTPAAPRRDSQLRPGSVTERASDRGASAPHPNLRKSAFP